MQEFDDFAASVSTVGNSVADMKTKGEALKKAVDKKISEVGQQAASDTAITQVGAA